MSVGADGQPRYIRVVLLERDGHRSSIDLKAWSFEDGPHAVWELRRFLRLLMPNRGRFKVGSLLHRDLSDFRTFAGQVGLCIDRGIRPSVRASASAGSAGSSDDTIAAEELRDEWSMETPIVLLLLVWWSAQRRMSREKELGKQLLDAWLRTLTGAGDLRGLRMHSLDANIRSCCGAPPVEQGLCCHANALAATSPPAPQACAWTSAIHMLQALFGMALQCAALARKLGEVCRSLAVFIDHGVHTGGWCSDPLRAEAILRGVKRNLRIDEDYKRAAMRASESGRAHNSRALMRALGEVNPSSSASWCQTELANYIAAGWMTYEGAMTICIAPDASRFGNLAEDTLAIPVYSPDAGFGHWCPSQAPGPGRT